MNGGRSYKSGSPEKIREGLMVNTGNTGQRYKLQKFMKVELQEILFTEKSRFLVTLECGHSYVVIDGSFSRYEEKIARGKRTRCNDCPVQEKGV
jgi:hypothetical protein